jgi:hypothetical protein
MAADMAGPPETFYRLRWRAEIRTYSLVPYGVVELVHVLELGKEREQMETPKRSGRLGKGGGS